MTVTVWTLDGITMMSSEFSAGNMFGHNITCVKNTLELEWLNGNKYQHIFERSAAVFWELRIILKLLQKVLYIGWLHEYLTIL